MVSLVLSLGFHLAIAKFSFNGFCNANLLGILRLSCPKQILSVTFLKGLSPSITQLSRSQDQYFSFPRKNGQMRHLQFQVLLQSSPLESEEELSVNICRQQNRETSRGGLCPFQHSYSQQMNGTSVINVDVYYQLFMFLISI